MSVPLPRVTCGGWTSSTGVHIRCVMPIIQTGEPGGEERYGLCALCYQHGKRAQDIRWRREGRKLLQDRKRTYGPQGGDPFAGFREPRADKAGG